MRQLDLATATVLAILAGGCSDDGTNAQPTPSGTGGASGTGGSAGADAAAGSAGQDAAPDSGSAACFGTESTDEKFSQAMQVLRDALAKHTIPGGAVAIVKDGNLVNMGVAGSKRASACDPIAPDTLFRAGFGASPLITTIAALDAVEDGKLSLTAPITDVIPGLSVTNGNASEITLHHLLSWSSNYYAENLSNGSQGSACVKRLADALANVTNSILKAPPGSMSDFLSVNIELAGLALENADGKPFAEAVKERVLVPLSMGGTFDVSAVQASDHAVGHILRTVEMPAAGDCANDDPSHGYYGSIGDVAKLAAYLTGGQGSILDSSTLDAMLSKQGPGFWSISHAVYGGAGYTHADLGGDLVLANFGGSGFESHVRIYKQRRLAVIVLINVETGLPATLTAITDAIARIYEPSLKGLSEKPFNDPAYVPDPASLPSLVGTYRDDLGFKGTGPRTLEIFLDPTDSSRLAGTVRAADGTSDGVTFAGSLCADNFTITLGSKPLPATDPWREVRIWRDATGKGSAIQLFGDNGPALFRVL